MPALLAVCAAAKISRQDVAGIGDTKRAFGNLPDPPNAVATTAGTSGNFPCAVELDIRREVVGKMNGFTVGLALFQSKLVRSGINLTKVVDASVGRLLRPGFDEVWNRDGCE